MIIIYLIIPETIWRTWSLSVKFRIDFIGFIVDRWKLGSSIGPPVMSKCSVSNWRSLVTLGFCFHRSKVQIGLSDSYTVRGKRRPVNRATGFHHATRWRPSRRVACVDSVANTRASPSTFSIKMKAISRRSTQSSRSWWVARTSKDHSPIHCTSPPPWA